MYFFLSAVGVLFHSLSADEKVLNPQTRDSMGTDLWRMYRLTILGDFDWEDYSTSTAHTIGFLLVTLAVNIIMLNVLISLVSEGFSDVHNRKREETRIARTRNIIELEATYTSGSMIHYKEGKSFHVTKYPNLLLNWLKVDERTFFITKTEEEEGEETVLDGSGAAHQRLAQLESDIKEMKELLKKMVDRET